MFLMDWFYGALASLGLWQKQATILILGLDNNGKTDLFHMFCHQRTEYATSEELSFGGIKFKAFGLEGHQMVRRVMNDYNLKVDAVVYLVKAFDRDSFEESRRELAELLPLANVPFLILGNTIGNIVNPNVDASELELLFHLGLNNLTTGKDMVNIANPNVRPLEVFMCFIIDKMDYDNAFKWLSQYIK